MGFLGDPDDHAFKGPECIDIGVSRPETLHENLDEDMDETMSQDQHVKVSSKDYGPGQQILNENVVKALNESIAMKDLKLGLALATTTWSWVPDNTHARCNVCREWWHFGPDWQHVSEPVTKAQRRQNPKAQAACDLEWNKLLKRKTWDPSSVTEWRIIQKEAQRTGKTIHIVIFLRYALSKAPNWMIQTRINSLRGEQFWMALGSILG